MIEFLTTPIFYLTPYIFLWSVLNGLLVVGLLRVLKIETSRSTQIGLAVCAAVASILWNWSIAVNQSTTYLNVDAPIFPISWADFFNGVCVFALSSWVLGRWIAKDKPAAWVTRLAGLAALVTVVTDIFFF